MRILNLHVCDIRGIQDLSLAPNGQNLVVWGPNGSGKSAVIDAIDFLLTGQILRLKGKGTGGIGLKEYGPRIGCSPEEAVVTASIQLHDSAQPVNVKRCMARPDDLECDSKVREKLQPIIDLARRGQHILTRREILRFIQTEPSKRAEQIQDLLNISEIEDIRKSFVRVKHDVEGDLKNAKMAVAEARTSANATLQQESFDSNAVIRIVNENRALLGGKAISRLHSTELKKDIPPLTIQPSSKAISLPLAATYFTNLQEALAADSQGRILATDKELRKVLEGLRADGYLLKALSTRQLTVLGLDLLGDNMACPLCDAEWPPGELKERLDRRLAEAEVAAKQQSEIDRLSGKLLQTLGKAEESLQKVNQLASELNQPEYFQRLGNWQGRLAKLRASLADPLQSYPSPNFDPDEVSRLSATKDEMIVLDQLYSCFASLVPKVTPEQRALEILTRLEENLKVLERTESNYRQAEKSLKRAALLLETFQVARDSVLGGLYDQIRDRFVQLYRQVHGLDESDFSADMRPEGAGLDFKVDFYGRGTHPPLALHSEGHQDSMGLCLFLALAERLNRGLIDLIMLDDVVMSVDADHRRQICSLLASSFPQHQFIITTHDRTWAAQLKTEKVVTSANTIEFYNWNVDTGPRVSQETDMWQQIENDVGGNKVVEAAGRLRRGSEAFFSSACDLLQAEVRFRANGRWELGDYLPGAVKQYRRLLSKAKTAANSWNQQEVVDSIAEVESILKEVYSRAQVEQWAVNANVHYNRWADFSPNDFRPVCEAFHDLCDLFICQKCGGLIYSSTKDPNPVSLRCDCGEVNWNLMSKNSST